MENDSMPAEPLTAHEREEIRVGIERDEPDIAIALRLGRHRSTIGREIARNKGRDSYSAIDAHLHATGRLARPKTPKLVADAALAAHVTDRLKAKDSPMTIAIELARGTHGVTATLSHECIYQAVYAHGRRGLPAGLHSCLHRRHRCRKHHSPNAPSAPSTTGPLGTFTLIHARPAVALERSEVGHFEGDLIVGSYNRSAIATVIDRASRHLWLARFPVDHGADETLAALTGLLERIPKVLRRTLTWDQGREMALHADLAAETGIAVFFAEPHSPWQRPTNENGNGLLRRYVGKGTDLRAYTSSDLRNIEHRINTMPRRSLNWATAHDTYTAAVAMTG
jgi:transposase, IS30 family